MFSAITWNIDYLPFTIGVAIALAVILILLFLSALISGSEAAYFSLSKTEQDKIAGVSSKKNFYILKNLESPEQLLATIVVVNNFSNVGIIVLSCFSINSIIGCWPRSLSSSAWPVL